MIGSTLGRYHILEKIGEGSMGVVYLARDQRLETWVPGLLAAAHAADGNRAEAQRILAGVTDRTKHGYASAYFLAYAYIALGDKDKALAALETDYEQRSPNMTFLKVDPGLDTLRNEPRFRALLKRLNFPQ
jgi:adenylate cyclase